MSELHELSVARHIAAPPETVYRAWTERLAEWFTPKPWTTEIVEVDFRAGGRSALIMHGPNGEVAPGEGVYLEVVPNERIVLTDAIGHGWIPQKPFMIGIFTFAPEGQGTCYTASARHWDAEALRQHKEMGFEVGWTAASAQLADIAVEMAGGRI